MAGGRFHERVGAVLGSLAPETLAIPPAAPVQLCAWLDKLVHWNEHMDLTAARNDDELVDLMVADAVLLARQLPAGGRVVDVGSGAGAPGLPLAMLRPDLALTLVEPLRRRATFLRLLGGGLPAPVPTVVAGRAEALRGSWEVAVSRATLPPEQWLAQGSRLAPRGEVWVLLAKLDPPQLAGWSCVEEVAYRWPLTGAERRALCYRAVAG